MLSPEVDVLLDDDGCPARYADGELIGTPQQLYEEFVREHGDPETYFAGLAAMQARKDSSDE